MFRRTAVIASLAAVVLALSACAPVSSDKPNSSSSSSGGSSSAPAADGELVVGLVLEPDNLDVRHTSGAAIEQILIDNIYQGLVTRDQDNSIVPALASDYEVSPDGLTYTFTLNEGVTFHGGQTLTSADVVASFTAVKDDATIVGNGDFQNVASITAPDGATVVITLTEPNINFLFTLTTPAGLIFASGDATDLKTAANGTGPFVFESWKRKDSITFTRNDAYWGTPAHLAEVTFVYIPDFTAGVNAATTGDLDVLTAVDPNLAVKFEGTDFEITKGKTTDKATLAFNNKKAPLDNVKVREALRLAIDHEALIKAVGSGTTQFGPIPALDPGYEDLSDVISYDPEKAKSLLAEAGVKDLELELTIPSFYGTTVTKSLVSDFNKIGVTLKIVNVEFSTWLNDVYTNHDYDLSFVLHVEPRDFANWAQPDYYFGYDNAEVQKLYTDALVLTDEKESAKLLAEAARIVSEDHAADWLYTGQTLTAHLPKVSGFPVDSVNSRINLADVAITE